MYMVLFLAAGVGFDDVQCHDAKCLERILYEHVGSLPVDSEAVAYAGLVEPSRFAHV